MRIGGFTIVKKDGFILKALLIKEFGFIGHPQIAGYGHMKMFTLGAGTTTRIRGLTFVLKVMKF